MDYGKALRIARAIAGLQQAELAELAALDPSHLSLIESGRRNPSLGAIRRISKALKIPEHILALLASEESDLKNVNQTEMARIGAALARLLISDAEPSRRPTKRRRSRKAA